MNWNNIKQLFDQEVNKKRFSVPTISSAFLEALEADPELNPDLASLREKLGKTAADYVIQGMVRFIFLIELVKRPKIETTKFEVRWGDRLPSDDPRYASFTSCQAIFKEKFGELLQLEKETTLSLLKMFHTEKIIPYEIPLDYERRLIDEGIHQLLNFTWFFDDTTARSIQLRAFLRNPAVNSHATFFREAYKKIQVKTYLTDRVLTGAHKTNREKRWETHPGSVHYALRRECLEIEYALVNQLCNFEGFPSDLRSDLEKNKLLTRLAQDVALCPITLEPLSYREFEREILDPTHGKAGFQVGHLNPLKAITDDPQSGHTSENVSWISSDGNRIQGHLSLNDTREMIKRIMKNYERYNVE